ncbi:hypothetical protein [Chroogloeocystis siderophila]|jgi:acyl-CoA reductase-like NAD-dependent aldehyde dehydrogenase|uniref:Uncharacterized protein n=1 Tax=Chroogloeocystis siderophila 5.2 s.c.1 TaxID=247279 RepID=A0A1U7HIJ0_9CHRO|nr:hypothetical protein [Chroogloeocystis siderophila]OKH23387.1 hypothetical protein NIES1031_18250 [Chroogloeocystis siderophila 5.2 s.c.1]
MESSQPATAKIEQQSNDISTSSLAQRRAFMRLSLKERCLILQRQAEEMYKHYQEDTEWQELEVGDIVDF